MTRFARRRPLRSASLELSDDQVATVLDLICRGSDEARAHVSPGMHESTINQRVWQSMRRIKHQLGLVNVEVYGEVQVPDGSAPAQVDVLRRPDMFLKFIHQFGNEDAYVVIEGKRVAPNDNTLNGRYVTDGVDRFATGTYAKHHRRGFMLGYVLTLPVDRVIAHIDAGIQGRYGLDAALKKLSPHRHSLAIFENTINQSGAGQIRLMHVFVDMSR